MARTRKEAPVAPAGADEECEEVSPAKKARASKEEAAKSKLSKAQARLAALEVQTAPLEHALSVAQAAKKEDREAALQKHLDKVYDQQQNVKAATEAVGAAEKAEAVKNLKALQASATAEGKAPMTVLGIRHLVQDRLEWQKVMDDKSNKNSGVWDKIAVSYNARVKSGVLPPSDQRSVDSLKAKWSTLDGAFKQHCRAIQRRKDSGASRDDVDAVVNCAVGEHGKTVATDIFFKFGRQERPAVVPPHAINGGSADKGGTYNAVGGGSGPTTAASPSPSASDGDSEDEGGEDGEEGGEEAAEVAKESAVPKPLNPGTDKYRPGKKGKGKLDPYLSMIHNMVEHGKLSDKAYEQREENREAANRKHQLEMMALIMGNQQRSHAT